MILTIACIGAGFGTLSDARAQSSNRNEVRAAISEHGWYVVWGVTINEAEYGKFTYAVANSVAGTNPGPVMAYFSHLAERNIDKVADQAPALSRRLVQDLVIESLDNPGRTISRANLQLRGGIATYRRWKTVRVPDGTERYKIYGPRNPFTGKRTWTYGYRPKFKSVRVPLPNHHQPYVKFRILRPNNPPAVAQLFTFWSYGSAQGGGFFKKVGADWVEIKGGKHWASFREVNATSTSVTLFDPSRNMQVRLDGRKAYWRYPTGSWNYLFERVQ
ncbi:hypothetical protein [Maioricimonas sp. JC845]|uniref:hypothetical protein n=1 Tax=Maioricimonas sp. JC845 TaxID=3232138 RepID=UPI003458836C